MPLCREDQPLVGGYTMMPQTAMLGGDSDPLRVPSYIGRNASFDRILSELPRSLSEVAMQAGHPNYQADTGGQEGPHSGGPDA
jgi:hypothetical protein